ncbi:hypothetical protein ACQJBY_044335 [Aegilops geniculata]
MRLSLPVPAHLPPPAALAPSPCPDPSSPPAAGRSAPKRLPPPTAANPQPRRAPSRRTSTGDRNLRQQPRPQQPPRAAGLPHPATPAIFLSKRRPLLAARPTLLPELPMAYQFPSLRLLQAMDDTYSQFAYVPDRSSNSPKLVHGVRAARRRER